MLEDIVNSLYNLGEIIFESCVIKKIIWSLPDIFMPKIIAIKESKDLDFLIKNELIGSLQTFEFNRLSKHKTQTVKAEQTIAFRTKDENQAKYNNCSISDFQEIANFARNFDKFMKLNKKSGNGGQNFGK